MRLRSGFLSVEAQLHWYATVCGECPAGCGTLVRTREGRAVKVEGNPEHPVNRGGLCIRGQSSLQGLYNPDRIAGPQRRRVTDEAAGRSVLEPVAWDDAQQALVDRLQTLRDAGRGDRIVLITPPLTGTMATLVSAWTDAVGGARWVRYEPVEVDDTWIGGQQPGLRGSRQLKGRRAALVLVAVEKRGHGSGRVRLAVIPDVKAATLTAFLTQNVAPGSTVYTDGLKSFTGLGAVGLRHIPRTQPLRTALRQGATSAVPLADRAIGNLQQWLIGTYHGVSRAQLQVYLDEFAFRHNRRRTPMAAFQTLLGLGTTRAPTPLRRIRGGQDLSKPRDEDA